MVYLDTGPRVCVFAPVHFPSTDFSASRVPKKGGQELVGVQSGLGSGFGLKRMVNFIDPKFEISAFPSRTFP